MKRTRSGRRTMCQMADEREKYVLQKTESMVRDRLKGESSGHDWWHIHRVRNNAARIAAEEDGADAYIIELASLLHDISDWKFNGGDDDASSRIAEEWLGGLEVPEQIIREVCATISGVSFKGSGVNTVPSTLEGMIVQDADRLDAMGAIGIARAFAYGGKAGREIFDPSEEPHMHLTFDDYKRNRGHTINHFYEKLLLLRDRMNTEAGRRIAAGRHDFMLAFIVRFKGEWEGTL